MRHGGDLLLRAGGEGDGGALACEETGRRRPDAASRAGYERDATGVCPAFGHSLVWQKRTFSPPWIPSSTLRPGLLSY